VIDFKRTTKNFIWKRGGKMKGIVKIIPIRGFILSRGALTMEMLSVMMLHAGEVTFSDDIVKYLQNLKKDERVKAVIFEINSSGGRVYPSKEIGEAIKHFGKPTIAQIREIGGSGAYWIASTCTKIVADPFSEVGGIGAGAIAIGIDFKKLSEMLEKIGVKIKLLPMGKYERITPPSIKEMEWKEESTRKEVEATHRYFVEEVKQNRSIREETVLAQIAAGRVYRGEKAKELGLVDYLGNLQKAIQVASELAGSQLEPEYAEYEERYRVLIGIPDRQLKF